MMKQANLQFGFEANDIPLMIEAIPISSESIILIISKVEDPKSWIPAFLSLPHSVSLPLSLRLLLKWKEQMTSWISLPKYTRPVKSRKRKRKKGRKKKLWLRELRKFACRAYQFKKRICFS